MATAAPLSPVQRVTTLGTPLPEAEHESQDMPDDRTADAARMGAPEVRAGASQ